MYMRGVEPKGNCSLRQSQDGWGGGSGGAKPFFKVLFRCIFMHVVSTPQPLSATSATFSDRLEGTKHGTNSQGGGGGGD